MYIPPSLIFAINSVYDFTNNPERYVLIYVCPLSPICCITQAEGWQIYCNCHAVNGASWAGIDYKEFAA